MQTVGEFPQVTGAKDTKLFLSNGREIIDAISSWWVITHGHSHPRIVEAIREQSTAFDQVLFGNFSHRPAEELVETLQELLPKELGHFFFSDNGSTAVEAALKMALGMAKAKGEQRRNRFISFEHSYHGDTAGAMSVGGESIFTKPYREMLFEVIHAQQGTDPETFIDNFTSKMEQWGDRVAAVIFEPLIQGAGGMIVWPVPVLQKAVKIAKNHGALVIFDEVMTGFGRTGKNFAFEHLSGLLPDILCLSKGLTGGMLPLALTVAVPAVYQSFLAPEREKMFFHGHSFTANPLACRAAQAACSLMKDPVLKEKWQKIHNINSANIAKYKNHPKVLESRICGTMAALELQEANRGYSSTLAPALTKMALEQGVFLRPLGNVLYILPPYCITEEELNQVWETIATCLERLP